MIKQASLLDPVDDLTQVLGPGLAAEFLKHRKMLKKPMTNYAAKLMATKLRAMPDPIGSVNQSILRGWDDVYEVKAEPLQKIQQFPGKPTMAALFGEMEEFFDGSERQAGSSKAAQGPILGIPFDGRKH